MTPFEHSLLSARDFGGKPEDYLKLHEYIDQTKFMLPHWSHRMFLHNTLGMSLCEQQFGAVINNSNNIEISTRELARLHICQDLDGKIPTLEEWVTAIKKDKIESWILNPKKSDINWLKENHYKR